MSKLTTHSKLKAYLKNSVPSSQFEVRGEGVREMHIRNVFTGSTINLPFLKDLTTEWVDNAIKPFALSIPQLQSLCEENMLLLGEFVTELKRKLEANDYSGDAHTDIITEMSIGALGSKVDIINNRIERMTTFIKENS